jgi:1-acyl-sn-glycerol-3-phosphate acyltransferase
MPGRTRYVPQNIRWFNRILRATYGLWLHAFFRVEGKNVNLAKAIKPPFVIVSNHVSVLDPFILGSFLREPVYWITSDGNMRSRLMRALLTLVGSIPKSKSIPDIETVNWTVEVIRRRQGVVGIFPEGQQTWDGTTLPLVPSTAKLLKLLKVPVLAAVIKGGYSSLPRWTGARRRGAIEVEFKLAFSRQELGALGTREIGSMLAAALAHDESAWEEDARVPFEALRRAERIELALFMCPRCEAVGELRSSGSRLNCLACGMALKLDAFGRIKVRKGDAPIFSTIRDWDRWQTIAFERLVRRSAAARPDRPIFSDPGALILRGRKMNPLRRLRTGTLILYPDRIELATILGERLRFPLAVIEGISVLKRSTLEFYVGKDLFQTRFALGSSSSRKWMAAVEILSPRPEIRTIGSNKAADPHPSADAACLNPEEGKG